MIHELRDRHNIPANCPCGRNRLDQLLVTNKNGVTPSLYSSAIQCAKDSKKYSKDKALVNGVGDSHTGMDGKSENDPNFDPLNMLAVAAVLKQDSEKLMISDKLKVNSQNGEADDKDSNSSQCSTLRDLLTRTGGSAAAKSNNTSGKKSEIMQSTLEDIIQKVVEKNHPQKGEGEIVSPKRIQFKHYRPRNGMQMQGRDSPIPTYTLTETSVLHPDIPHAWLDHGKLLWLVDPKCKNNIRLFQQQWRRSQPALVSNCDNNFRKDLWNPQSFSRDFGDHRNDLVNCANNTIVSGNKMKTFWDGFEKISSKYY